MKLETSTVTKLQLTELDNLDPISVILENYEPGKGKIIIECCGKSWSSFWSAMSGRTVEEFFIRCDEGYLADNLQYINETVDDESAARQMILRAIINCRRSGRVSQFEARELWTNASIQMIRDGLYGVDFNACNKLFDCSFYELDIPQKPNPHYVYLCRIIKTVQEGLREYIRSKVAV